MNQLNLWSFVIITAIDGPHAKDARFSTPETSPRWSAPRGVSLSRRTKERLY